MTFEEALKAMKMGNKLSREPWRDLGGYWHYNDGKLKEVRKDGYETNIDWINSDYIFQDDWYLVT